MRWMIHRRGRRLNPDRFSVWERRVAHLRHSSHVRPPPAASPVRARARFRSAYSASSPAGGACPRKQCCRRRPLSTGAIPPALQLHSPPPAPALSPPPAKSTPHPPATLYLRAPTARSPPVPLMAGGGGSKSDRLLKRLLAAGISPEACDKYLYILRAFLTARISKERFEEDLSATLPPEKRFLHNAIVRDLMHRAQQKRDGLPDLPVLLSIKDKRPSTSSRRDRTGLPSLKSPHALHPPTKSPSAVKAEPRPTTAATAGSNHKATNSPTSLLKRPFDDTTASDLRKSEPTLAADTPAVSAPSAKRHKARPPPSSKPPVSDAGAANSATSIPTPSAAASASNNADSKLAKSSKAKPSAGAGAEKPSPASKRRKSALHHSNNLPPPSPTIPTTATASQPPPKLAPITSPLLETYDGLPFMPGRPGPAMDLELFSKLKVRMRPLVEACDLSVVKDDAVALVAFAIEVQVKRLLQAAVAARRRRAGKWSPFHSTVPYNVLRLEERSPRSTRNASFLGPVRPFDLHESALSNVDLLADDSVLSLERLSMLL